MARYRITSQASTDLDAIWLYIAEHSPVNADRFMGRFYDIFLMLAHSSHIGTSRSDLALHLRMMPMHDYLIFYRPIDDGVEIMRVLHGRRRISRDFF